MAFSQLVRPYTCLICNCTDDSSCFMASCLCGNADCSLTQQTQYIHPHCLLESWLVELASSTPAVSVESYRCPACHVYWRYATLWNAIFATLAARDSAQCHAMYVNLIRLLELSFASLSARIKPKTVLWIQTRLARQLIITQQQQLATAAISPTELVETTQTYQFSKADFFQTELDNEFSCDEYRRSGHVTALIFALSRYDNDMLHRFTETFFMQRLALIQDICNEAPNNILATRVLVYLLNQNTIAGQEHLVDEIFSQLTVSTLFPGSFFGTSLNHSSHHFQLLNILFSHLSYEDSRTLATAVFPYCRDLIRVVIRRSDAKDFIPVISLVACLLPHLSHEKATTLSDSIITEVVYELIDNLCHPVQSALASRIGVLSQLVATATLYTFRYEDSVRHWFTDIDAYSPVLLHYFFLPTISSMVIAQLSLLLHLLFKHCHAEKAVTDVNPFYSPALLARLCYVLGAKDTKPWMIIAISAFLSDLLAFNVMPEVTCRDLIQRIYKTRMILINSFEGSESRSSLALRIAINGLFSEIAIAASSLHCAAIHHDMLQAVYAQQTILVTSLNSRVPKKLVLEAMRSLTALLQNSSVSFCRDLSQALFVYRIRLLDYLAEYEQAPGELALLLAWHAVTILLDVSCHLDEQQRLTLLTDIRCYYTIMIRQVKRCTDFLQIIFSSSQLLGLILNTLLKENAQKLRHELGDVPLIAEGKFVHGIPRLMESPYHKSLTRHHHCFYNYLFIAQSMHLFSKAQSYAVAAELFAQQEFILNCLLNPRHSSELKGQACYVLASILNFLNDASSHNTLSTTLAKHYNTLLPLLQPPATITNAESLENSETTIANACYLLSSITRSFSIGKVKKTIRHTSVPIQPLLNYLAKPGIAINTVIQILSWLIEVRLFLPKKEEAQYGNALATQHTVLMRYLHQTDSATEKIYELLDLFLKMNISANNQESIVNQLFNQRADLLRDLTQQASLSARHICYICTHLAHLLSYNNTDRAKVVAQEIFAQRGDLVRYLLRSELHPDMIVSVCGLLTKTKEYTVEPSHTTILYNQLKGMWRNLFIILEREKLLSEDRFAYFFDRLSLFIQQINPEQKSEFSDILRTYRAVIIYYLERQISNGHFHLFLIKELRSLGVYPL